MTKPTTTIDFHVHDADAGQKIAEYLNGKTFFNFLAHCASYPCAGNERVYVATSYPHGTDDEREAEVTEMVMSLLGSMATGH